MFNNGFYPTPANIAAEMLKPFEREEFNYRHILEPSAGKGDLAQAIISKMGGYYRDEVARKRIHCIEIDPELQSTIKGLGFSLVSSDFLTFEPDEQYDLIIMNPPFSNGVDHLLHAWDILYGGDIVCLLNAQSIINPKTTKDKILASIIEGQIGCPDGHQIVKKLGRCFKGSDVFREADVEVMMVHLKKEYPKVKFSFDSDGQMDRDKEVNFDPNLNNQLAIKDTIGNMVLAHQKCLEIFKNVSREMAELAFYIKPLGRFSDVMKNALQMKPGINQESQRHLYNLFAADLKKESWKTVFNLTGFSNLATEKVSKDFSKFCEENQDLSFSIENIARIMDGLFNSRRDILQNCIVEVFNLMTRYDKKNKVHVEGWKTNDAHKVNQKVIIPLYLDRYNEDSWRRNLGGLSCRRKQELDDIDRAMGFLVGKKLEDIYTINTAIEKRRRAMLNQPGEIGFSDKFESEFFEIRVYLKGTIHLIFKLDSLWEKFNMEAAKGKNWLPDDYKHREKANKKYGVMRALPERIVNVTHG